MADSTYVGISAGGHARQHNGDVINSVSQCEQVDGHFNDSSNADYRYKYSLRARDSDASLRGDARNRLLLQAAAEGQLPRIQHLLRLGADVDFSDDSALRALHHAVLSGFEDCVQELITAGADINVMTQMGVALNLAAQKERSRVAAMLLRARADRGKALAFAEDDGQNLQEFLTAAVQASVAEEQLSAQSGVSVLHKARSIEKTSNLGGEPTDEHAHDSSITMHGRQPEAQVTTSQASEKPQLSRTPDSTLEQPFPPRSFLRMLMGRKSQKPEPRWERGNIGLTTLYKPPHDAVADIIFIHGAGGGSKSTWMKDGDPSTFWPLEWLSKDRDFRDVGIHTFGYHSSGGSGRRAGGLCFPNIRDSAQSLLQWFTDCADIGNKDETPVFFVCHSVGGLIAKQAYISSRQSQPYSRLAARLCGMLFLATPHRVSSLAGNIHNLSSSPVDELSILVRLLAPTIQVTNKDFLNFAQDRLNSLRLYSFYESSLYEAQASKKSNVYIVDKDSAILGYPGERVGVLYADHRNMSKYESRDSPNYRLVRNALVASIEAIRLGNATTS